MTEVESVENFCLECQDDGWKKNGRKEEERRRKEEDVVVLLRRERVRRY